MSDMDDFAAHCRLMATTHTPVVVPHGVGEIECPPPTPKQRALWVQLAEEAETYLKTLHAPAGDEPALF